MDRIILRDIVCQANVGVSQTERAKPQAVILEAELFLDLKPAGTADELALSVDYVAIQQTIQESAHGKSYQLLETLAEDAADALFQRFCRFASCRPGTETRSSGARWPALGSGRNHPKAPCVMSI